MGVLDTLTSFFPKLAYADLLHTVCVDQQKVVHDEHLQLVYSLDAACALPVLAALILHSWKSAAVVSRLEPSCVSGKVEPS